MDENESRKSKFWGNGHTDPDLEFDEAGNIVTIADRHKLISCRICDDKGYVRKRVDVNHPDFGKAFPCPNPDCEFWREHRMRKAQTMMEKSGIGSAYRGYTFESWDNLPGEHREGKLTARYAMEMYTVRRGEPFSLSELWSLVPRGDLRERAKAKYKNSTEKKSGVILAGLNGTSKTGLMAAAAMQLTSNGHPVLFANTLEILSRIFSAFDSNNGESADKLRWEIKNVDHLFFDEMTFETRPGHRNELQLLTRFRHDRDLPMCFTTNLTYEQFEDFFKSQTSSGVLGKCHWLELGGKVIRHEIDLAAIEEPF